MSEKQVTYNEGYWKPSYSLQMIKADNGDLITVGGLYPKDSYSKSLTIFRCKDRTCKLAMDFQLLKVARAGHVALMVPCNLCKYFS